MKLSFIGSNGADDSDSVDSITITATKVLSRIYGNICYYVSIITGISFRYRACCNIASHAFANAWYVFK